MSLQQLIEQNPFRVLDLPSKTTMRQLRKALSKFEKKKKVGLEVASGLSGVFRESEEVHQLTGTVQRMDKDPGLLATYRLLWPVEYGVEIRFPEDIFKLSNGDPHTEFLGHLYSNFTNEPRSLDALERCLDSWVKTVDEGNLAELLQELIEAEEGVTLQRAEATVKDAIENLANHLYTYVAEIAVAAWAREPNFALDIVYVIVNSSPNDEDRWIKPLIELGKQLNENLKAVDEDLLADSSQALACNLKGLASLLIDRTGSAGMWLRTVDEYEEACEKIGGLQALVTEFESLPENEKDGDDFLKALVALHIQRSAEPQNTNVSERWRELVITLPKIKPDVLERWLRILKDKGPTFVEQNAELIESLKRHAHRVRQAEAACEDPKLPRAVRAVASVCRAQMLDVADEETADIRELLGQSLDVVRACERGVFLEGVDRVKITYPELYGFNVAYWGGAAKLAGTTAASVSAQERAWAGQTGSLAVKQPSGSGAGCLVGLFIAFLMCVNGGGGGTGGQTSTHNPPPPPPRQAPADADEQKKNRLMEEYKTLNQELETAKNNLETRSGQLDTEASALQEAVQELNSRRDSVDPYDDYEVDAFNAKMDQLRSRDAALQERQREFNEQVDEFNTGLARLRELESTLRGMGVE